MWLIRNNNTGKLYKTKYDLSKDRLCHLYAHKFVSNGVLTVAETLSDRLCIDKFPFIEVVKRIDGRSKECKGISWFTWLCVTE